MPGTIGELLNGVRHQTPQMGAPQSPLAALKAQRPPELKDWQKIVGILSDGLRGYGGGSPAFGSHLLQMQEAERERQQREQEAGANREAGFQDFVRRQEYERANPAPARNATIEDFNWYKRLSDEDRSIYEEMNPEWRVGQDGRYYRVEKAPTRPVGKITPLSGTPNTPSGSPLRQPTAQPQTQQPSSNGLDRLIQLYGPQEGVQRYLKLIGAN